MHRHTPQKPIFQDMTINNLGKKNKKERTKDVKKALNQVPADITEKEVGVNEPKLQLQEQSRQKPDAAEESRDQAVEPAGPAPNGSPYTSARPALTTTSSPPPACSPPPAHSQT